MKNTTVLLFFTVLLLYTSCQSAIEADLGVASQYYPTASHLQDGIVNKYRTLFESAKDKEIYENILYRSYQLKDDQLFIKNYNVAGELEVSNLFSFQQGASLLKEQFFINDGDTIVPLIHQAAVRNWETDTSTFHKTAQSQWGERITYHQQLTNKDSTILDKSAKLFEGKRTLSFVQEQDTTVIEYKEKEIFVTGLGLFYKESNSDRGQLTMKLVEQLSFQDFKKISNHNRHRVAYIDSTTVINKNKNFQLCDTQSKIADYYNGQPDAGFNGGKGALKRAISSKLDTTKLHKESGFLTFRFVINCKGEIGWFTTEQADLDYQRKQFNEETVQHFYEIISQLTPWHATVIQEEAKDSYAYLTIKLKDGAITDLLP